MDWAKVDAPLASALAGTSDNEPLPVFVHLDRSRADEEVLASLDVDPGGGNITTAFLSPAEIERLTDQDWVLSLRLSGRLRLLGP